MIKISFYTVAVISLLIFTYFLSLKDAALFDILALLCTIIIGIIIRSGYPYIEDLSFHSKTDLYYKPNEKIRISFAYLLRIMVKDPKDGIHKFLLVESNRIPNSYQPPGGVYKMFSSSYLRDIGGLADDNFHEQNDFRFQIPRKKIPELLEKFDSRKDREVSVEREFYEELISTDLIPKDLFPWVDSSYVDRKTKFEYSDYFEIEEFKLFEIYDVLLNENQESFIQELLDTTSDKYVFADQDIINTGGYKKQDNLQTLIIRPHTKHLFS
jgi:hypothetical protein